MDATLYREHVKKHGSQAAEEKLFDDWGKEAEEKRRGDRQKANEKKEKTQQIARMTTIVTNADAIQKYKGPECKGQLQAWGAWLAK